MTIQLFFRLVKGGIILPRINGFTLIEVLIAASIIFLLISTILPISFLIEQERTVLSERRVLTAKLHDELQPFLWSNLEIPSSYSKRFDLIDVTLNFTYEEQYIKGCADWENARKKSERICLYGYQ